MMPDPEVREPVIPSKGYTLPPVAVPATVTDAYGCRLGIAVDRSDVVLTIHGRDRVLNADQRKDFMLAWNEAERQAEAHEAHGPRWCNTGLCRNGSNLHEVQATCGVGHG